MAGFTLIADLVAAGKEFGIFEFYLPFVIMFAIFWAILTKIKLFGDPYPAAEDKKDKQARMARGINLIISLGASLYIMANTTIGISFATFLSALFGGTFMVILTIIAFVSVVYVATSVAAGGEPFKAKWGTRNIWWFIAALTVIGAIVFALSVYISSSGTAIFPGFVLPGFEVPSVPTITLPSIGLSSSDLAIIFLVVITGLIIFYVTREGKGGTPPPSPS